MDLDSQLDLEVLESIFMRTFKAGFHGEAVVKLKNGRPVMVHVNEHLAIHQTEEVMNREDDQSFYLTQGIKHECVKPRAK